jgi:hypothetical protein
MEREVSSKIEWDKKSEEERRSGRTTFRKHHLDRESGGIIQFSRKANSPQNY